MENNGFYSKFIESIQQRRNNDEYDYCRISRTLLMHEFFAVNKLNLNDVIQCSILSEKLNQLSIDVHEKVNNYIGPAVVAANPKNYQRIKDLKNHWKSMPCDKLVLDTFFKKHEFESKEDSEILKFKKNSIFDPEEIKSPDLKKSKLITNSKFKEFNEKKNVECRPVFNSAKSELLKQNENYKSILYDKQQDMNPTRKALGTRGPVMKPSNSDSDKNANELIQEEGPLKNIEKRMVNLIQSEIMDHKKLKITWNDIIGLEFAKTTIQEIIIWPILRPDIFCGLRRPPRGLLLFGPPGTGKTMIGKCIASESHSTFFSISASTLTSKWIGEAEKMVRALFAVAKHHQPSVIFIDEIDSLLCQRSDNEHESTRRIKTEFLVQIDGVTNISDENDRILLIGATNRPHELDEAARRRFVKRLYIPLPTLQARRDIIKKLLESEKHELSEDDMNEIASKTDGLSAADMRSLCNEASLCPIRDISQCSIKDIAVSQVRPILLNDFFKAIEHVRPSVSDRDLKYFMEWNEKFGSFPMNSLIV